MDIVLIFNGLGNQMSQYAFYLAKRELSKNTSFVFTNYSHNFHEGYTLGQAFHIYPNINLKYRILLLMYKFYHKKKFTYILSFLGFNIVNEPINYEFSHRYLESGKSAFNYYWGGWHSEKYFANVRQAILKAYTFNNIDNENVKSYKNMIFSFHNSISVHVRRGDYLNVENSGLDNVCDINYYEKAITFFNMKYDNCEFFVFSDDITWCKHNIIDKNVIYVDFKSKIGSWNDMYLMSICKHHINANSTFSWWAAWLTPYDDSLVIRPHQFINGMDTVDFYPENWIDIDNVINV